MACHPHTTSFCPWLFPVYAIIRGIVRGVRAPPRQGKEGARMAARFDLTTQICSHSVFDFHVGFRATIIVLL